MFKITIAAALMIGLVFAIAGCNGAYMQHEETAIDLNWGRSYETAKYKQILNPDAGQNLDPVEGLDGTATENEIENYRKTFKDQSQEEVVNILKLQ